MTTDEKARAYDKALERAIKINSGEGVDASPEWTVCEVIFPELRNEDNIIKRQIINYFQCQSREEPCRKHIHDKWIDWLEKQKDTNVLIQEASEKAYTEGMRVERKHWLESHDKQNPVESSRDYNDIDPHFGISVEDLMSKEKTIEIEQKPILDFKACNWYVSKVDGKIYDLTYNPTDKVGPKFKVGDWIVNNISKDVFLIKNINNGYYTLEDIKGNIISPCLPPCESESHLWTIQDAKDGDILAAQECYVIFKEIDGLNIKCHCTYHYMGFNPSFHINTLQNKTAFHPATKEQCVLLFQKMKEEGYRWNAETKELKKIEQKSAWSEEDEKKRNLLIDILNVNHPNGYFKVNPIGTTDMEAMSKDELVDWLKSLRPKSKQGWSKEDEKMLHTIIVDFKGFKHNNTSTLESHFNECIDWLKSLKDRLS